MAVRSACAFAGSIGLVGLRLRAVTIFARHFFLEASWALLIWAAGVQAGKELWGNFRVTTISSRARDIPPISGGNRLSLFPRRDRRVRNPEITREFGIGRPSRKNFSYVLHWVIVYEMQLRTSRAHETHRFFALTQTFCVDRRHPARLRR